MKKMNGMRRCLLTKENGVYRFARGLFPNANAECTSSSSSSSSNSRSVSCSHLLTISRSYIKIRMQRGGRKNLPYYRIVVANTKSPRDGKFIEKVPIHHSFPSIIYIVFVFYTSYSHYYFFFVFVSLSSCFSLVLIILSLQKTV